MNQHVSADLKTVSTDTLQKWLSWVSAVIGTLVVTVFISKHEDHGAFYLLTLLALASTGITLVAGASFSFVYRNRYHDHALSHWLSKPVTFGLTGSIMGGILLVTSLIALNDASPMRLPPPREEVGDSALPTLPPGSGSSTEPSSTGAPASGSPTDSDSTTEISPTEPPPSANPTSSESTTETSPTEPPPSANPIDSASTTTAPTTVSESNNPSSSSMSRSPSPSNGPRGNVPLPAETPVDTELIGLRELQVSQGQRDRINRVTVTLYNRSDGPLTIDAINFDIRETEDVGCSGDVVIYRLDDKLYLNVSGQGEGQGTPNAGPKEGTAVAVEARLRNDCTLSLEVSIPQAASMQPRSSIHVGLDLPYSVLAIIEEVQPVDPEGASSQEGEQRNVDLCFETPMSVSVAARSTDSTNFASISMRYVDKSTRQPFSCG